MRTLSQDITEAIQQVLNSPQEFVPLHEPRFSGNESKYVQERENEIEELRKGLGVQPEHLFQLGFPTTKLDTFPMGELIAKVSEVFQTFQPEEVFIPHQGDVHSDHRITFEAVSGCTKWFRYPSVKRVLSYETLSETEFSLDSTKTLG